ncbi:sugar ABC transporter substrate-binding protein [Paenibacillus alkaliterrae]|uniref:ABC transporter substrate-binding protein n=1 Tax=Paenibacillus alkaliterrae TaxID=320909 RepID=UPI001F3A11C3|nr:sugar ABC transporter substrate-binding protein [Paenibacillus alkaliterrae]MCF2941336.1 sugar ABC transporter substrate-binding protein [Paenibacillus alkaliterrae]
MVKLGNKKASITLVCLMIFALLLAACSSNGNAGNGNNGAGEANGAVNGAESGTGNGAAAEKDKKESVTITAAMQQHSAVDAIKEMLPEFEQQTGIKVQFDILPQEELHSKTELALASNSDQYDVVMMDMMFTTQYAKAGWVSPLEDLISANEATLQSDDFMEGFLSAFQTDGHTYGLPFYGESTMLMYNKEMFEQAGIANPPTTIDELIAAAKELTKDGKYGIAMRGARGEGMNIYVWAGFYNAFGGKWLVDGKPVMNSPEAIKATEVYADLIKNYAPPGGANFSWDQVQLAVQQGTVAMAIDATNFAARLESPENSKVVGKIGYAPVPSGPAGSSPSVYTAGLVVPKGSEHQEAAFEFISWATSKEIQLKTAIEGLRADATRKSVWEDQSYRDKYNYEGWTDVTVQAMEEANADYRPRIKEWKRMGDRLGIAVSEVLASSDAKEALDSAQKDIEQFFK